MVETTASKAAPPASTSARSTGTAANAFQQAQPARRTAAAGAHIAAAATIDEILASEARANLQRSRETSRDDTVKYKARALVPPAKIVVRPSQPHAWITPFIALAGVVGLSIFLCSGAIAYLFVRPMTAAGVSNAEIRSLRESVAQLRRNVADLSNSIPSRTIADHANKVAGERGGRPAQNTDRAERETTIAARTERAVRDVTPPTRSADADAATEVTGAVQQAPSAPRETLTGWNIRRVYDGTAVLDGTYGVVEVSLGQDVPGLGRIQEIKYVNGRWQILTSKGAITSTR